MKILSVCAITGNVLVLICLLKILLAEKHPFNFGVAFVSTLTLLNILLIMS